MNKSSQRSFFHFFCNLKSHKTPRGNSIIYGKNVFKYYNKFMLKIIEGNISCKAVLEEQKRKCEILYVDKKKGQKILRILSL